MTLLRLCDIGKLFVTLSFYLMLCSSTQRDLVAGSAAQKYVTIKNIGIKMCQARCAEQGGCESFQYDIQTLTCRLPSCEMTMFTEESESTFLLKDPTHVLTGACGSKSCRLGSLCVRTRSGKAACVKGGKQFSQERCLQKKRDKNSKDVNNQLHAACCEGDMCQVRNILGEGDVDINSRTGQYNRTPVMVAAREGHVNVLDFLVKNGCDLRNVDANGDNILHRACYGGHIKMVKYVLSHTKLDINSRGVKLMTSLMQAAYFGHTKVFALLAYRGGDVFLTDVDGHNILYVACSRGHIEMVKYVLSQTQLDINSRGHHGRTPLMAAAYYGHYKVFKLLVDGGGDISLRDAKGDNILHRACSGGHIEMVKYVLSHTKLDINNRGHHGRTPLMAAAYYGHYKVFKLLMDRGGDVSLRDAKGDNILHRACSGGHIEMVKYVLSHTKLDINSRGHHGRTPLMAAAYYGDYKVFKLLMDRGGDISLRDAKGDNILHRACSGGHIEMVKYVLSHTKLDINSRGHYGRTPLMAAAYYGDYKVFKLLMDRGGDVSLRDGKGNTILHRACSGGHIEMVKYVLSHTKLDINSRGHYGRTPLMAAAYNGHYKVFKLLVDRGSDVSLKDVYGDDIIHIACSSGHLKLIKFVLSQDTTYINNKRALVDSCK